MNRQHKHMRIKHKQLNQNLDIATPAGGFVPPPNWISSSSSFSVHRGYAKVWAGTWVKQEEKKEGGGTRVCVCGGGGLLTSCPHRLFDTTIMVHQMHLLTKAVTLAVHKHQSSNILTLLTWVIDALENSFLRTLRSSLNKRTLTGGGQIKKKLTVGILSNTRLYSVKASFSLREFKWQLTLMEET